MYRNFILFIIGVSFLFNPCFSQDDPPKREIRAAWIATVSNIDWPSSPTSGTSVQKSELISLLDKLKSIGINAVFFQVRPECDAFYDSDIEPWSYWLTGSQGTAPSPYYDPLEFAIEEAHKRCMELHTWLNPYRATQSSYTLSSKHVIKQHPEWCFTKDSKTLLDPGLPQVRNHVTSVIVDIVNRYDVDGIHFDDYFYPYEGMNNSDDQDTYDQYPNGISNRADWRRNNVNILVAQVYDTIQDIDPHCKFGISPFGIWKSEVPSGITGMSAYDDIYCDALAWLDSQAVDYLTPQLYWPFGGGQDYGKLLPWWAEQVGAKGRHLYPGQAAYRASDWSINEIPNQVKLNRETDNVYGSVYFSAKSFDENGSGFADSLKNNYYYYRCLIPSLSWKDTLLPNPPRNLRVGQNVGVDSLKLQWDIPTTAADGDSATQYVLYRFDQPPQLPDAINDPRNIFDLVCERDYNVEKTLPTRYYLVTALDRNHNESNVSNVISVDTQSVSIAFNQLDKPNCDVTLELNLQNWNGGINIVVNYTVIEAAHTTLGIYDLQGRLVAMHIDKILTPGVYKDEIRLNQRSRGLYIIRLVSGSKSINKRMIIRR